MKNKYTPKRTLKERWLRAVRLYMYRNKDWKQRWRRAADNVLNTVLMRPVLIPHPIPHDDLPFHNSRKLQNIFTTAFKKAKARETYNGSFDTRNPPVAKEGSLFFADVHPWYDKNLSAAECAAARRIFDDVIKVTFYQSKARRLQQTPDEPQIPVNNIWNPTTAPRSNYYNMTFLEYDRYFNLFDSAREKALEIGLRWFSAQAFFLVPEIDPVDLEGILVVGGKSTPEEDAENKLLFDTLIANARAIADRNERQWWRRLSPWRRPPGGPSPSG